MYETSLSKTVFDYITFYGKTTATEEKYVKFISKKCAFFLKYADLAK